MFILSGALFYRRHSNLQGIEVFSNRKKSREPNWRRWGKRKPRARVRCLTSFPSSDKLTVAICAFHMTLHSLLLRWGLDKDVKSGTDKPEICGFPDFIQRSPTESQAHQLLPWERQQKNALSLHPPRPPFLEAPSLHSPFTSCLLGRPDFFFPLRVGISEAARTVSSSKKSTKYPPPWQSALLDLMWPGQFTLGLEWEIEGRVEVGNLYLPGSYYAIFFFLRQMIPLGVDCVGKALWYAVFLLLGPRMQMATAQGRAGSLTWWTWAEGTNRVSEVWWPRGGPSAFNNCPGLGRSYGGSLTTSSVPLVGPLRKLGEPCTIYGQGLHGIQTHHLHQRPSAPQGSERQENLLGET